MLQPPIPSLATYRNNQKKTYPFMNIYHPNLRFGSHKSPLEAFPIYRLQTKHRFMDRPLGGPG